MSHKKPRLDAQSKNEPSEEEIFEAKRRLHDARSEQLLQSLFPNKLSFTSTSLFDGAASTGANDDDDDDFDTFEESAGLGTIRKKPSGDEAFSGLVNRKPAAAAHDKLLENLLGSKAAKAKKKSLAESNRPATASKPLPTPVARLAAARQDEDSDDDGGRAAAFTSKRKRTQAPAPEVKKLEAARPTEEKDTAGGSDEEERAVKKVALSGSQNAESQSERRKAGGGGYLDELLAAKENKKKKKKKKKQSEADIVTV